MKSCPKCNKSPNLVTLDLEREREGGSTNCPSESVCQFFLCISTPDGYGSFSTTTSLFFTPIFILSSCSFCSVWPGFTIFERPKWQIFFSKVAKIFCIFWAALRTVTPQAKLLWLHNWQLWELSGSLFGPTFSGHPVSVLPRSSRSLAAAAAVVKPSKRANFFLSLFQATNLRHVHVLFLSLSICCPLHLLLFYLRSGGGVQHVYTLSNVQQCLSGRVSLITDCPLIIPSVLSVELSLEQCKQHKAWLQQTHEKCVRDTHWKTTTLFLPQYRPLFSFFASLHAKFKNTFVTNLRIAKSHLK